MTQARPRIVFLIDEVCGTATDSVSLLVNIHLVCLRLLSYYAHKSHSADVNNSVLWGYKFFNSTKQRCTSSYKQYPFLDFTAQNFDTFEKSLYTVLQENPSHDVSHDVYSVEMLRRVFTELLCDFDWQQPELFSPSKNQQQKQDDEVSNFVYMFTPTPNSHVQLLPYSKDVKFSKCDQFLRTIFPKSLYAKFICQLKIRLFWVDTNQSKTAEYEHVTNSIGRSLTSINGSLINIKRFSSWWMYCQTDSEKRQFVDGMNTSSYFDAITSSKSSSSPGEDLLVEFKFQCNDIESTCQIFISTALKHNIVDSNSSSHPSTYIKFKGYAERSSISLNMLQGMSSYHYVLLLENDSTNNTDVLKPFTTALKERKAMRICWFPPGHSKAQESLLLPFTKCVGALITLKHSPGQQQREKTITEGDDVISRRLIGADLSCSLVQCVDEWFVANPCLGVRSSDKSIVKKIHRTEILQKQKQEDKSKDLIQMFKKSLKSEKPNGEDDEAKQQPAFKMFRPKKKQMKGISWSRWRLLEYHSKRKEKNDLTKECAQHETKEDNKSTSTQHVEDKPLEVQDFKCQEALKTYLDNEWAFLQSKMINKYFGNSKRSAEKTRVLHRYVHRFVMTAVQFFCSMDEARCQDLAVNFVEKYYVKNVEEMRECCAKSDIVFQYLLQVQLLIECATAVKHSSTHAQEKYLSQMVMFLRSVTFEESPSFVRNHLKTVVTPCFLEKNKSLLQSIYENLMFEVPECLESSNITWGESDKDSPIKSMTSSIGEYHLEELSSMSSQQQSERRTLRRIPSAISDINTNKRTITVHTRKTTTADKRLNKKETTVDKRLKKTDLKRERSLDGFGERSQPGLSDTTAQRNNLQKTPKFKRRHSEILLRKYIPETPEGKQRNDLMWKKQELNRRISKVDKSMQPIEESPVKHSASPVKERRRVSLCRSYSFTSQTSPRRFYAVRRISPTCLDEIPASKHMFIDSSSVDCTNIKNILFSNFDGRVNAEDDMTFKSDRKNEPHEKISFDNVTKDLPRNKTRRNIFNSRRTSSGTSNADSADSADSTRKRKSSSGQIESVCKKRSLSMEDTRDKPSNRSSGQSTDVICDDDTQSKFKLSSDNTLDWLSEIDRDKSTEVDVTFKDAFQKLSSQQSPLSNHVIDKCNQSPFKQSPTIVRAGNQAITVSPLLSVSSLETLENAPILSPVGTKKNSRKRRSLHCEYTSQV